MSGDEVEHRLRGELVMSKGSRRRVGAAPGCESLEVRSLPSGYSGPMTPFFGRSAGTQSSPPAMVASLSASSPAQCSGPNMSAPSRPAIPGDGWQSGEAMPDPERMASPPASSTVPFVQTGSPAAVPENSVSNRAPSDATAAGQTAAAGSEPGAGAAVLPAIARPSGNPIGVGPSHGGKPIASADIEITVAPGVDPSAPGAAGAGDE